MQRFPFVTRIKEVAIQIAMIGLGVGLCAMAKAQTQTRSHEYHRYQGPAPSFKRGERRQDEFSECRNKYQKRGIPAEVYQACVDAVRDAEELARSEATSMGCEDGFFAGFSAGLYDGAEAFKNDQREFSLGMNAGLQRAMSMIDRDPSRLMNSAALAGSRKGDNDGEGDARNTWVSAIDRGIPQPNPQPQKDLNFTGSEFQFPYAQLVAQPQSLEQLARDRSYDANQLAAYHNKTRQSRICNNFRLSQRSDFRGGNYYRKDGRYAYDRTRAVDGRAALERSTRGSSSVQTRQKALQGRKIEVASEAEAAPVKLVQADKPAAEKPASESRGANGPTRGNGGTRGGSAQPANDSAPTGATAATGKPADPSRPTPPAVVYDLWKIYSDNLQSAYSQYAEVFYNNGFYDLLDDGSDVGFEAGIGAGLDYAQQQGRVAGFDSEFRKQEFLSYNRSYQNQYQQKYSQTFSYYRTTPVVRAQLLDIVETVNDGIFQPGESIKAIYALKNYGGVPARVTAQLQGAGIEGSNTASAVIPAVSSKNVADGVLTATLKNSLESLQNAEILLVVSGGDEIQRSGIERQVTRQVTLNSVTTEPLAPAGVVKVSVAVQNRSSKIATSDDVKIVIVDNAGHRLEPNLGTLKIGEILQPTAFEIKGIDPLAIYKGAVSISVQVFKGTQLVAQTKPVRVAPNTRTAMTDLTAIFDNAVQSPAQAAQASAALEQLMAEVTEEIGDVKNSRYEKNPEGTLLNEVVKTFLKRSGQSANARARYTDFANKIRPLSRQLTSNRLFGRKSKGEKAFLGMLDTISQ